MKEAVTKVTLCHSPNPRSLKRTSMRPCRSYWNGTTSALQPEEITSKGTIEFHVCTINKSAHTKKSLETYLMILVYSSNKHFLHLSYLFVKPIYIYIYTHTHIMCLCNIYYMYNYYIYIYIYIYMCIFHIYCIPIYYM